MMKVTASKLPKDLAQITSDVLVVGCFQPESTKDGESTLRTEILNQINELTDRAFSRFISRNPKFGKLFEGVSFYISPKNHKTVEKVVVVGFGKLEKLDTYKLKQICGYVGKNHVGGFGSVSLFLPREVDVNDSIDELILGFASGMFDPGHQKSKVDSRKSTVESLEIFSEKEPGSIQNKIKHGQLISDAIYKVREVVNLPGNIVTPKYLMNFAKKIAEENKLKITVFDEKQVNQMGMGIMASVAQGSEEDLYFVTIEYKGAPKGKTLALVGKGITFDSGGLSIKPSESMEWMKMDMAGAAVVFGAIDVIAKLKLPINVIVAAPLTENLLSGKATKPGDIVKGLSGKTVEVINTDAEGRLVLSDALSYVQDKYKPDYIVDVATLTGASVVALGTVASAALGRPQQFVDQVIEAGGMSGERLWQLPLYDEYREMLKSYIADIANVSGTKGAGTETGAKFLEEFVSEKISWAHLDIAPTAWEESEKPYQAKGASGFGVATMVNLARDLAGK